MWLNPNGMWKILTIWFFMRLLTISSVFLCLNMESEHVEVSQITDLTVWTNQKIHADTKLYFTVKTKNTENMVKKIFQMTGSNCLQRIFMPNQINSDLYRTFQTKVIQRIYNKAAGCKETKQGRKQSCVSLKFYFVPLI